MARDRPVLSSVREVRLRIWGVVPFPKREFSLAGRPVSASLGRYQRPGRRDIKKLSGLDTVSHGLYNVIK